MDLRKIEKNIKKHEGWRARPYPDPLTGGEPYTFGYGFTYITREEGEWILRRRVQEIVNLLQHLYEFAHAPEGVQEVLVEMAYQLGISGLILFKRMFAAIRKGNYARAAEEILNSRLARQTPARARWYAERIRKAGGRKGLRHED